MSKSWSISQKVAVLAAASVTSGYAWLRWKCPTLWSDIAYARQVLGYFKTIEMLDRSRTSLVDFFEKHVQDRPNHPCILFENEMHTYADVSGNANRVARWVSGSDPSLKKGDVVCVLLNNSPTFVWTWLGLLKLGIISSLINYNLKGAALLHCIRASEGKTLIFGSEFLDVVCDILPELRELNVSLWMVNGAHIPGLVPPHDVVTMEISTMSAEHIPSVPIDSLADLASYIYTSGTTGMPKPALIPHAKLLGGAIFYHMHTHLCPDDVYYIALPMYHSAALLIAVCGSLQKGATLAIVKKFSASRFWDDVRRYNVTIFQYIGEICRYLLAQPKKDNDGQYQRPLRAAVGNGLRMDIWEAFQQRFNIGQIFEFYGATEGNFTFVNADGRIGTVGKLPWTLRRILDIVEIVDYDHTTGQPKRGPDGLCIRLPPGKPGLLVTKVVKKGQFTPYKGTKEVNEKKLVRNVKEMGDEYFNTGDLMTIDAAGYVYFVDRLGDTFRWKGENVSTNEVSNVISIFPAILEANVYGVHVPGHDGRAGMAAIVLREGAVLDCRDLYQHVTSSLPDYACPKFLRLVEEMDLTGTYKHRKTDLAKKGFTDEMDEVFIIEPSQKAYVPITHDHIKVITTKQSKL